MEQRLLAAHLAASAQLSCYTSHRSVVRRKPVISLFQGFRSVSEVVAAHWDVHGGNAPAIVNVYFVVHLLK